MKKDCTFHIFSLQHLREPASNTLQMTLTGICENTKNARNKKPTAEHSLDGFKHSRLNFLKSQ
jgi:hypothetical protein